MSKKLRLALVITSLVLVNAFLVWPLFLGEYDKNVASIGIAHILNARYISRFFTRGWNPFWYGGFPNHLIYPLLAPITLALIQKLSFGLLMAQVGSIIAGASRHLLKACDFKNLGRAKEAYECLKLKLPWSR